MLDSVPQEAKRKRRAAKREKKTAARAAGSDAPAADFDGPGDLGSSFAFGEAEEEPVEAADCTSLLRLPCHIPGMAAEWASAIILPSSVMRFIFFKNAVGKQGTSLRYFRNVLTTRCFVCLRYHQSTSTRDGAAAGAVAVGAAGLGAVGTNGRHAPKRALARTQPQSDHENGTAL